jgi:hypothetical protein
MANGGINFFDCHLSFVTFGERNRCCIIINAPPPLTHLHSSYSPPPTHSLPPLYPSTPFILPLRLLALLI